jgi:hypothetical protein
MGDRRRKATMAQTLVLTMALHSLFEITDVYGGEGPWNVVCSPCLL